MADNRDLYIEYYKAFRKELDEMCVPSTVDWLTVNPIMADGKIVGFMGIIEGFPDYIDSIYVLPEYRRKGLAKKAVEDFIGEDNPRGVQLVIINNNEPAKKFWNSLFELREVQSNPVDTCYEIVRRENDGTESSI